MNVTALRIGAVAVLAVVVFVAPGARAATPPPEFIVTVYAQGEAVNALVASDGKPQNAFVKLGAKHDFDFARTPSRYKFEISACGRVQARTLIVPPGHPGALITVYRGCSITIGRR